MKSFLSTSKVLKWLSKVRFLHWQMWYEMAISWWTKSKIIPYTLLFFTNLHKMQWIISIKQNIYNKIANTSLIYIYQHAKVKCVEQLNIWKVINFISFTMHCKTNYNCMAESFSTLYKMQSIRQMLLEYTRMPW